MTATINSIDNHKPSPATEVDAPTPFLLTNLDVVVRRLEALTTVIPGLTPFYAMKCNPAEEILRTVAGWGASFEVASFGELRSLQAIGVDPADLLYSNPVKPPSHVSDAHKAGLWRFCVDAPGEVVKVAEYAPGAAVYVRLRVDDSGSVVPLSHKFGTSVDEAYQLMLLARERGLQPYGVTFHVGSQATRAAAWRSAIADAGELMRRLRADGIDLQMLDLGGGFPARYVDEVPLIEEIGTAINEGLDRLPYEPALLAAEPGRFLVAEAGVLAAAVIGRVRRGSETWLFTEVGNYHGLGEVLPTPGGWRFPLSTSVDGESPLLPFTLTGPSCDSTDTWAHGVLLPSSIDVGDIIYIGTAGAYTVSYATHFNGFDPPAQVFVRGFRDARR
jgi:ornithine decarboxylase